jgi:hypothetical protein
MRQINLTYAKQPFDVWAQQHNKVLY